MTGVGSTEPARSAGAGFAGAGAGNRVSLDEARELWLRADDDELRSLAQAPAAASTSPTAPPTW